MPFTWRVSPPFTDALTPEPDVQPGRMMDVVTLRSIDGFNAVVGALVDEVKNASPGTRVATRSPGLP